MSKCVQTLLLLQIISSVHCSGTACCNCLSIACAMTLLAQCRLTSKHFAIRSFLVVLLCFCVLQSCLSAAARCPCGSRILTCILQLAKPGPLPFNTLPCTNPTPCPPLHATAVSGQAGYTYRCSFSCFARQHNMLQLYFVTLVSISNSSNLFVAALTLCYVLLHPCALQLCSSASWRC